jgi:hypothetical protein
MPALAGPAPTPAKKRHEEEDRSDPDDDQQQQEALPKALAALSEWRRALDQQRCAALADLDAQRQAAKREADAVRSELARVRASLHELEEDDEVEDEEHQGRGSQDKEAAATAPAAPTTAAVERAMAELQAAVRRLGPAAEAGTDEDENI